jgi:Protein of unknown function (DUF2934)
MRRKAIVPNRQGPAWEEWVQPIGNRIGPGDSFMHEAISRRAYSYWEARGFQGGSAEEDWLRAEGEIQLERCANAIMKLDRAHLQ